MSADWRDRVCAQLEDSPATRAAPLAPLTTLRVGGPAELLVDVGSEADLLRLLACVRSEAVPYTVLGKGSNVLVPDLGLRGVVLRLGRAFQEFRRGAGADTVWGGAGLANATFVERARLLGLGGMEFLVTIPGSLGGAIAMNAGAFQDEIAAHLLAVRYVDLKRSELAPQTRPASEFAFRYRGSPLRGQEGVIVLTGEFRLAPASDVEIEARKEGHMTYRRNTQPREYPNCGSVFKNPPGDFAARLIEQAGLKGRRCGGAQVSEKHANFIVNRGGATAAEVLDLIDLIQRTVYDRSQIRLEPEVQLLGGPGAEPGMGLSRP